MPLFDMFFILFTAFPNAHSIEQSIVLKCAAKRMFNNTLQCRTSEKEDHAMADIKAIIELYKSGKISKFTMESELTKYLASIPNVSVRLTSSSGGHTVSSYIAGFVPVSNGVKTIPVLLFDNYLFAYAMDTEDILSVLRSLSHRGMASVKELADFVSTHNGAEVPMSECILFYIGLAKEDFAALPKNLTYNLTKFGVVSFTGIEDYALSLKLGKETPSVVLNGLVTAGILSKEHIELMKALFHAVNAEGAIMDTTGADPDTPTLDAQWHKIIGKSDGEFDVSLSKNLDPAYTPDPAK